jgi:hypothetical protein
VLERKVSWDSVISEISNPNGGKGMEKFVKCYSDLTGKNSFILTCYLSTLIEKECSENMIVT